jgi:L-aspartate oxidase
VSGLAAEIRPLPAVTPQWQRSAEVVVVGSGAAGITTALSAAAHGLRVLIVTKDLTGGASPLAQGGLAAAIGPGDSADAHARDTMIAGAGLCDGDTVAALAAGSPGAIDWLVATGARLERRGLRLEGGHGRHRIVHSGDDASGAEVHRALLAALLASPVEILDHAAAVDLVMSEDGSVAGISVGQHQHLAGFVSARAVVVAAGGLGQAFGVTTNPAGATGDGVALAARAGAVLRDLEFVQFHPTVLWSDDAVGQRPLITEALRGAGAVLRDLDGKPLMAGRHPLGDLAPRDIVAAAMFERIAAGDGAGHLWLDATALGRGVLEDGFPTVTAACRKQGVDPVTDLIPVAPAAHYSCGGIAADLAGRTSIPGLYAVGEAASTGVHGANRLASNSLVEAVIMARNAGDSIARDEFGRISQGGLRPPFEPPKPSTGSRHTVRPRWEEPLRSSGAPPVLAGPAPGARSLALAAPRGANARRDRLSPYTTRETLATTMSRHAGVVRDADGLREVLLVAASMPRTRGGECGLVRDEGLDLGVLEATNLHTVSVLIAAAALHRTESRGCHRRRDAPATWPEARHTLIRWTPDGLGVTS